MASMEWEAYKPEIERLYLLEGKTLESVRHILSANLGFSASKKQYERKIQQWGFRKYKMNPEKWKFINRRVQKRKQREGKESEVHIAGSRCPPEKIQEGIARHGFVSTAETYTASTPKTPEDITVFTPAALSPIENQSVQTSALLPKKANLDPASSLVPACRNLRGSHPASPVLKTFEGPSGEIKNLVGEGSFEISELHKNLSTLHPKAVAGGRSGANRPLELGVEQTGLPKILDEFPESTSTIAEIATQQRSQTVLPNLLKYADWSDEEVARALDPGVAHGLPDIFRDLMKSPLIYLELALSGVIRIIPDAHLYDLVWIPLHYAVLMKDHAMVRRLLNVGFQPNRSPHGHNILSALQLAVQDGEMEIVNLLLNAGADVNYQPLFHIQPTALQIAVSKGNVVMMERLLSAGADVNAGRAIFQERAMLEAAAERGNIDMIELLLRNGARVDGEFRTQYIRAVLFAQRSGHYGISKKLKDYGEWTESDEVRLSEVDVEGSVASSPFDFLDLMAEEEARS